jgi:hypothetical protein
MNLRNIVRRRWTVLAFVVLAAAFGAFAGAQNQPDQGKKDPLAFVKVAAVIAANVQHETVVGATGIYIDQQIWAAALRDGDLGPFIKVKEAKTGRSAACLFSESKDSAVCVYFDGDTPFGVAAVKAAASGKIDAEAVAAAFKPVSKEMLKKGNEELSFSPTDVATDDGQPLPAFLVTVAAKPKA